MFSCARLSILLALALPAGFSQHASAQGSPSWSADAGIGGGTGKGSAYFENDRAAARLAVSLRASHQRSIAVYGEAGFDWLGLGGNPDLICLVDRSSGACKPPYSDVTGPSASIGVLFVPFTRVEMRVGVGGAAYSVEGARVGAAIGQLDAAVFPTAHLGVAIGTRLAVIPRYRHERLSIIPVLLGLRVR